MKYRRPYKALDLLRLLLKLTPGGIIDIPDKKIAKLFNLKVEYLHDLVSGHKHISKKMSHHFMRLENLLDLLGDCILDELGWLGEPNKVFDNQRPIDMLRTAKGYKQLMQMVEDIQSGAYQ